MSLGLVNVLEDAPSLPVEVRLTPPRQFDLRGAADQVRGVADESARALSSQSDGGTFVSAAWLLEREPCPDGVLELDVLACVHHVIDPPPIDLHDPENNVPSNALAEVLGSQDTGIGEDFAVGDVRAERPGHIPLRLGCTSAQVGQQRDGQTAERHAQRGHGENEGDGGVHVTHGSGRFGQ